jgi:hypothetical protein
MAHETTGRCSCLSCLDPDPRYRCFTCRSDHPRGGMYNCRYGIDRYTRVPILCKNECCKYSVPIARANDRWQCYKQPRVEKPVGYRCILSNMCCQCGEWFDYIGDQNSLSPVRVTNFH